jgi:hypothetical protein
MRGSLLALRQTMMWSSNTNRGAFTLSNNSTSIFSIRSAPRSTRQQALPGQDTRLDCGSWQLILGAGLGFEIKILPYTPRAAARGALISLTTVSPIKFAGEKGAAQQKILKTLPSAAKPEATRAKRLIPRVGCVREGAETTAPRPRLRTIIFKNHNTKIFATTCGTEIVAVKVL